MHTTRSYYTDAAMTIPATPATDLSTTTVWMSDGAGGSVVAFDSATPEADFLRSMIATGGGANFALPPLATVTLEDVFGASETILRNRLLVVSVAYRR